MKRALPTLLLSTTLALATAVPAASPPPTTPPSLDDAVTAADTDRSGALSPAEAKKGGFFVEESFPKTDGDGSGSVTLFELNSAIARSTQQWVREHDAHDTDDDGHVDREEAAPGSRIFTIFDRADTNNDGKLDLPEVRNFATRSYYSETAAYPVAPNLLNKKF